METIPQIPSQFEMMKRQILSEFKKEKIEGINTEQVEDYMQQQGLGVKPYIIIEDSDLPKLVDAISRTELLAPLYDGEAIGLYSPELDMAFVLRERGHEKANGMIYTEGNLVHELAHAISMFQYTVSTDSKHIDAKRAGFVCATQNETPWGWLLEEGWADMHRADYFAKYASPQEIEQIAEAYNCEDLDAEDTVPMPLKSGEILPMPVKYVVLMPNGIETIPTSAVAGYTLELLCTQDPTLPSLLAEARSTVQGLRKLAQALEKIKPGLYTKMQATDYSLEDFQERLSFVMHEVVGGTEKLVRAKGGLRDRWDDYLFASRNE